MKYLFIYDISDNKRLAKISNLLKQNGIRTQYSFFECNLSEKNMLKLYKNLIKILSEEEDKLFVIPVNSIYENRIIRLGNIKFQGVL